VIDVAELAATGADLDQLVAHAESLVAKVGVVAMLDTLEHLIKADASEVLALCSDRCSRSSRCSN